MSLNNYNRSQLQCCSKNILMKYIYIYIYDGSLLKMIKPISIFPPLFGGGISIRYIFQEFN